MKTETQKPDRKDIRESKSQLKALCELGIWDSEHRLEYRKHEKVLVDAGICVRCFLDDGDNGRLGKWQPGNRENYAGKQCFLCEEFYRCGEQPPEYESGEDEWRGDADPGL